MRNSLNYSNASIALAMKFEQSGERLYRNVECIAASSVDNVENFSTRNGDKPVISACFVNNVENFSTRNGDKPEAFVSFVDNVENFS